MGCFYFMLYVLRLIVWNLKLVSENDFAWSRLPLFSYSPLLKVKIDEKNFQRKCLNLNTSFKCLEYFVLWNFKNTRLLVYVRIRKYLKPIQKKERLAMTLTLNYLVYFQFWKLEDIFC